MTIDSRARRTRLAVPACMALLAGAAGCDFPTELPKWDTSWVIPAEETAISVKSLLPAGVTVSGTGTAFVLSLPPVAFSRSIGEMCAACAAVNGLVVPKPAFTAEIAADVALPANLVSVQLTGGRIEVRLQHDFNFDPLRPGANARGFVVLTASSGSTQLAKDSINGANTALPPNTPLVRSLPLGNATIAGPITVKVVLSSPAGDPVQVDTSDRLSVTATPAEIRLASATIRVPNREITATELELDLADVEADVADRVKGGAIRLAIDNPFDVTGTIDIRITGPGIQPIVRSIQIAPGATQQRVTMTGAELRSILGRPDVRVSVSGKVSSPTGGTAVRPGDKIKIGTRLELTVGPKEN